MLGAILRKMGLRGPKRSDDWSSEPWEPDPNDPTTRWLFHASNTLAGPCPAIANLDGHLLKGDEKFEVPVPECSHPDQCACFFQYRLEVD